MRGDCLRLKLNTTAGGIRAGLGVAGLYFGRWYGHMQYSTFLGMWTSPSIAHLWLVVLSGVLLGYLIGGGIVWAVRILGSLAFGKEAMGLGDVHLMAAVGASG